MAVSKLDKWKKRLGSNDEKWNVFTTKFDHREALVRGENKISPCCDADKGEQRTYHVRNICAELIEAQVDTAIPTPKVTAKNKEDEQLAHIIETMLLNELERMPMRVVNDSQERTVPIQGGSFWLTEWDNTQRTHTTIGEVEVQYIHPKQVVPQDGVYTSIEDMDYIFLKLPQTKEYIRRRYGVSMATESEEEPDIRGFGETSEADGLVTQYVVYYRNDSGGIGRYSWVNDTELEDIEDYQARRLQHCKKCGAAVPLDSVPLHIPSPDGKHPTEQRNAEEWMDDVTGEEGMTDRPGTIGKAQCPYCGSKKMEIRSEEFETLLHDKITLHGKKIPAFEPLETMGEDGNVIVTERPTRIPYYKPNLFPVIMQKNVSVFGQLMGDSDIDRIEPQQNTLKRLSKKIMDKLLKAGSFATLPTDATITLDNNEMKYIRLENAADKTMIDVFDMEGNIEQDLMFYHQAYEEARQQICITDSFQGRQDTTATSGKAKEFAAQQSAGRLESKRVMKEAAWAELFEALFKFKLAYADEPRVLISRAPNGDAQYDVFDRYDFLKQDAAGEWFWEDRFIFSVDTSTPLAKDREAMWQELRMNLQTGAFGDPTDMDTLILFWSKMKEQHYPGADDVLKSLEEKRNRMAQQQAMMMQQQTAQQQMILQQKQDEAEATAVGKVLEGAQKDDREKTQKENAEQRSQGNGQA